MNLLALLALGVTLAIEPTSGPAPLAVHPIMTVTGPFDGLACLSYERPGSDEGGLIDCLEAHTQDTLTLRVDELRGGAPGRSYNFKVTLKVQKEDGTVEDKAESNIVVVTTDPVVYK